MKDLSSQDILAALKENLSGRPSAVSRIETDVPAERQMHFIHLFSGPSATAPEKDFFFLIVRIDGKQCEAIPGSLDGMMATPSDVVLPPAATGQYAYLAVDLATTVPLASLGAAFAVADDALFRRILASRPGAASHAAGESRPLPHALPFINKHDSRIAYRKKLIQAVKKVRRAYPRSGTVWKNVAAARHPKIWSLAASLFIVGAVAVYFFVGQNARREESIQRENFIAAAPSGVLRGGKNAGNILSPQATTLSATPVIAVGGTPDKKYLAKIIDLGDNRTIARQEISGGEILPWTRCSERELQRDTAYRIVLYDHEKVCAQRDFWLLGTVPELKGTALEKAQTLYRYGCYAEAYLLLLPLYEKTPDDPDLQMLFKSCVQKLDLE